MVQSLTLCIHHSYDCVCVLHILTGWLKLCVGVAVVSTLEETRRKCEDPFRSALFSQGAQHKEHIMKTPAYHLPSTTVLACNPLK